MAKEITDCGGIQVPMTIKKRRKLNKPTDKKKPTKSKK